MGNVYSLVKSRPNYKKELKEWKKVMEKQLAEKNNAINNLNEVLRQQNKRIQHIHNNNQQLSDAMKHIVKQLKSRVSILTSHLREASQRIETLASSFETTKQELEDSSTLISSAMSELKEVTQRITDVGTALSQMEFKVLQTEKKINHGINVKKQTILESLLQEINELEDEKDGLLRFTEEALGIHGDEEIRTQLHEKINSTLEKVRRYEGSQKIATSL
ncbi:uncharacterized protein LOC111342689 isoform X1 [Stylophora pistillata]|uniref:uncharacterized protein LOC111342689 isoform X1 n=1 Tax=Stylophora pistillata TaxID=50429 RepID=UPI000C04BCEF|nr:uncharacterized protein LOC111342689 isoform X1 [Stylophora pistillata]